MRPSTEHDRVAIKAAARRALKRAGGGDCFCHATRVGAPTLSYYVNPGRDDMHMPIDVVLDLDREAGAPIVTGALASLQGYRLVPMEAVEGGPNLEDLATIAGETGDVVRKFAEVLADGRLDPLERVELSKETEEAVAVLSLLLRKLAGEAGE